MNDKGQGRPPECLVYVATLIEKDQHTLIVQSTQLVLLKIGVY